MQIVGLDTAYCVSNPVDTIFATSPATQLFGGPGITQISNLNNKSRALFDPAAAGPGIHIITYHTGAWAVHVYEPVPVTLNPFDPVCIDDTPFILTGGSPGDGIYTVDGTDLLTTFNPSAYGAGTHYVTYRREQTVVSSISDPGSDG